MVRSFLAGGNGMQHGVHFSNSFASYKVVHSIEIGGIRHSVMPADLSPNGFLINKKWKSFSFLFFPRL